MVKYKINLHKSFVNASDKERNEVCKAFEPLTNKMVNQYYKSTRMDWDELKCMAYEGLVRAMNTFDPSKTKQTFTQFAAYMMRYNILNSLTREGHSVTLTSYGWNELKKSGGSTFISVSLDYQHNDRTLPVESRLGIYYSPKFECGDIFGYMYNELESKFNSTELDIFYQYFGLNGRKEIKLKDIAKGLGISSSRASQHLGNVLRYIRKNDDIREMLTQLISK